MVASAANPTSGISGPVRRQFVKRTIDRMRIGKNQGPLTEVVQQQSGQDQAEPGAADRRGPDMAHVGVKRLRAGQREEDAAHDREGDDRIRAAKRAASSGLNAFRMSGAAQMLMIPSKPMTTNQMTITGPNSRPILAVPRR